MNCSQLKERLAAEGFLDDVLVIEADDVALADETYVIAHANNQWHVYYAERGERVDERMFTREDDACTYAYDIIQADSTTR